jgi:hypothetical protein
MGSEGFDREIQAFATVSSSSCYFFDFGTIIPTTLGFSSGLGPSNDRRANVERDPAVGLPQQFLHSLDVLAIAFRNVEKFGEKCGERCASWFWRVAAGRIPRFIRFPGSKIVALWQVDWRRPNRRVGYRSSMTAAAEDLGRK